MDNRIIKLVTAGDGNHMADVIAATLEQIPTLTLDRDLTSLPDEHSTAVLVFLLTERALDDPKIRAFARRAEPSGFPVLPVVPEHRAFDFRSLTGDLTYLGRLNAVGWDQGDQPGELVFTAIRRHLGLEPFRRDCRLFISYRRSDGSAVAQAIHRYFRRLGYDAFLDTEDEAIEPGEAVQSCIAQAIPDRDFLLLIDSPDAADSEWVRKEVTIALENRVALFSVRIGGTNGFPQVRGLAGIEWHDDEDSNLRTLERYIASTLAARRSFDRRLKQTLAKLELMVPLQIEDQGKRRLLLRIGEAPRAVHCLLEFEDANYDLMRLYRLSRGCATLGGQIDHGVLVHRGRPLSDEECAAVDWARGTEPLQILALDQVASHLANLVQPVT
ncbi:toll/interleukin-1 receptor domain-containing protein [Candidatus Thiosymbion oneisti]|uniref:toll/interleukin-1 receptor domain-containing protein n=1 Tax=Candidatus Thiosymbion oneisti TaxID=589554 RepID=UPI00105B3EEE|nr:toll/interleukin-1 receptor domain-containing protein [Candidatus Thiosymbion oneisti]